MSDWGFKGRFLRAFELPDGNDQTDELAPPNRARLIYDQLTKYLKVSVDQLPYRSLITSSDYLISVETLEGLAATDDTVHDDGKLVTVLSVQDTFRLSKTSTVDADGITVIGTDSGVGRWHRLVTGSPDWAEQDEWYIDQENGDDEADGATALTPIRTHEELMRRWRDQRIDKKITISIVGNHDEILIHDFYVSDDGLLYYTSEAEVLHTGTITSFQNFDPTLNQPPSVEDSALPGNWGDLGLIGHRIRTVSGSNPGALSWLAKDLGSKTARVCPFSLAPLQPPSDYAYYPIAIAEGDHYVVEKLSEVKVFNTYNMGMSLSGSDEAPEETLSKVFVTNLKILTKTEESSHALAMPGGEVTMNGCHLENIGCRAATIRLNSCFCDGFNWAYLNEAFLSICCSLISGIMTVSCRTNFWGCLFSDMLFSVLVFGEALFSRTGFFDVAGDAIWVGHGARVFMHHPVYGTDNDGYGTRVQADASFYMENGHVSYLTGDDGDFIIGNSVKTHAEVPFINMDNLAKVLATP